MKTIHMFRVILAACCVAGAVVITSTGCSSDRTQETTGEGINDAMISNHVRDALGASSDYKYSDVQVDTFKGTVQLSGFVDTGDRKSKAETVAKQVEGVKDVVNNITVK